jgi:hypothetical protein
MRVKAFTVVGFGNPVVGAKLANSVAMLLFVIVAG